MRLFAAVLPPESAVAELRAATDRLRTLDSTAALRWAARPGWHLTLAFYGEVPPETVPKLSARLARAAARTAPFRLALRGGGQFGDQVLWAGVAGSTPVLRRLAERAEAAGRKAGLPPGEHRRHRPHLTLARGRAPRGLGVFLEELDGFEGAEWTVDELALVRSDLPHGGSPGEQPRYTQVGGWRLGGAG